jgi:hypothetical protein
MIAHVHRPANWVAILAAVSRSVMIGLLWADRSRRL